MAVLKNKRDESSIQFLENAYELQVCMIRQAVKFPKRYTFFITQNLVALATSCHHNAKSANTIYPTNQHELQIRIDYLNKAMCDLQNLISQLQIAKDVFSIDSKIMATLMKYISDEFRLLKGVRKSDRERFKDLITVPQ